MQRKILTGTFFKFSCRDGEEWTLSGYHLDCGTFESPAGNPVMD